MRGIIEAFGRCLEGREKKKRGLLGRKSGWRGVRSIESGLGINMRKVRRFI